MTTPPASSTTRSCSASRTCRLRGGHQVARPFSSDPVVARGELGNLVDLIGQVGELVHHELGAKRRHCPRQRICVEHVTDHRLSSQLLERRRLLGRPRHARDFVSVGGQQRDQPQPDHTARAGQKDAHDSHPLGRARSWPGGPWQTGRGRANGLDSRDRHWHACTSEAVFATLSTMSSGGEQCDRCRRRWRAPA